MFQEPSPVETRKGRTSGLSSKNSSELVSIPFMSLDLTPGAGNLLDEFYWELLSPWRGESLILNTGPAPRSGAAGSTLWSILEAQPHPRYFLTRKACQGIIRRASERGKPLPPQLQQALEIQAGTRSGDWIQEAVAFAQNQRDEVRDLHNVAGALGSQPGMKQQTFVAAGVVTKGNGDCFLTEDVHTSLTSGGGQAGQGYPCVLCLNDQGGQFMSCSENITGTLRAQMNAHQPLILESNQDHATIRSDGVSPTLPASMGMGGGYVPMVYENHGIDSRYTGPYNVVPTISARCGTGGNNVPLVGGDQAVYCISGNIVDREPENGGNGLGFNEDISFTLTATDRHAVFSRQRTDVFAENDVVSTESARQHKDATDLIMQPYQETVGTLVRSDHKGISNQYVNDDKCIVCGINLIRRLTPLECERLQGFPDGWTNIPSASDSARYKALGNSVAIPCVDFVMKGIALVLHNKRRRRVWIRIWIVIYTLDMKSQNPGSWFSPDTFI